ncbi:MAG: PD-(D/E)XK nuclease family protein [Candidatus Methylomirabilota bacterium]
MIQALTMLFFAMTALLVCSVWRGRQARLVADVPTGYRVIAADLGHDTRMDSRGAILLRDNEWGITGKVDLLLKDIASRAVIPVEYKPTWPGFQPGMARPSHILQLATALVLCQGDSRVGQSPREGWIRYVDRCGTLVPGGEVHVPNTPEIRKEVFGIVQRMRRALVSSEELHRDHRSMAKCRRCSVRNTCGEVLAA